MGPSTFSFACLCAILAVFSANLKYGDTPAGDKLPVAFDDDFGRDSRKDYRILGTGGVDWQAGRVRLGESSLLTKDLTAGPSCELDVELDLSVPDEDREGHTTECTLRLGRSGSWAVVRWQRQQREGKKHGEVQVLDFSQNDGKALYREIRSFPMGVPDGRWKVRFHFGVVDVLNAGTLVGRAYNPAWHFLVQVEGFNLVQKRGAVTCKGIRFRGAAPFPMNQDRKNSFVKMSQLLNQATQEADADHFEAALDLNLKALHLGEATLGASHPQLVDYIGSVGLTLGRQGQYEKALIYIDKALAVARASLGPDHPEIGKWEAIRASNEMPLFAYESALASYLKCLSIYESVYGRDGPELVEFLDHLGECFSILGNRDKARTSYERALQLLVRAKQEHGKQAGLLYAHIMEMKYQEKRVDVARDFGERAAASYEALPNKLQLLSHLLRMGTYELRNNDKAHARKYFEKALEWLPEAKGPALVRAGLYMSLADWYQSNKEEEKILDCYAKGRELCKKAHGEVSEGVISFDVLEAMHRLSHSQYSQARAREERAFLLQLALAHRVLPYRSEGEALKYMLQILNQRDLLLFLYDRDKEPDPAIPYRTVWDTRGVIQRAMTSRQSVTLENDEAKRLFQELGSVREALASLTRSAASGGTTPGRELQLEELSRRKDQLERELGRISEQFRSHNPQVLHVEDLVRNLPEDVAIVEFVPTPKWRDVGGAYGAFVLRKQPPKTAGFGVRYQPLGSAAAIDNAVASFRFVLQRTEPRGLIALSDEPLDPGDGREGTLRELLWKPLEPHLQGCKTVLIVPEGVLCRVPWAALPGRKAGTFLIEDYALATASSGQTILGLLSRNPVSGKHLLIVGGVDYGASASPEKGSVVTRSKDAWQTLPGTLDEAIEISAAWKAGPGKFDADADSVVLKKGKEATASQLLAEAKHARYIHLATHGYFAERSERSILQRAARKDLPAALEPILERMQKLPGKNPLLLSGIVLAGANAGGEGVLTAEQLMQSNLHNTELVTLSACETGLGEVGGGEGVFGLQRAFEFAGARSIVSTQWKVEDKTTRLLMAEFYRNLWQKNLTKAEALRQAQITLLRRYDPRSGSLAKDSRTTEALHPAYWASFGLHGDWRR